MSHSHLETAPGVFNPTWIPDWSTKGYRNGAPLPDRPATISYPVGRHTITQQILLTGTHVLKGAGIGLTTLYFPNPLSVMLNNPVPPSGQSPYSWQDGVIQVLDGVECGIEDLTIEFPLTQYPGHFREQGYNGISLRRSMDCWVRNIEIIHSDSGLFIERDSQRVTATGIRIRSTRSSGDGKQGHHGIELQRVTSCVVHDFEIRQQFHHPFTFEDTEGCVCSQGRGDDQNIDHHKSLLGRNVVRCLVTDYDLGSGSRHPFESSGNPIHPETGAAQNVYWGNRKNGQDFTVTPSWQTSKLVIVSFASTQIDSAKHLEHVNALEPRNLWLAQTGAPQPPPPTTPPPTGGPMEQTIPGPGTYPFTVPTTGEYTIEGQVTAPSLGSNSFLVAVDGGVQEAWHINDLTGTPAWRFVVAPASQPGTGNTTPQVFTLPSGSHTVTFALREPGTAIHAFRVVAAGSTLRSRTKAKLVAGTPLADDEAEYLLP